MATNNILDELKLHSQPIYFDSKDENDYIDIYNMYDSIGIQFRNDKIDMWYDNVTLSINAKIRKELSDYEKKLLDEFKIDTNKPINNNNQIVIKYKSIKSSCIPCCKSYVKYIGFITLNDNTLYDSKYKLTIFSIINMGVYKYTFSEPRILYSDKLVYNNP